MDLGRHRFTYAICGHTGDWRNGRVPQIADRANQPLVAFQVPRHAGSLLRSFAFVHVGNPAIAVRAVKMAEDGDEVVVRLQELHGVEQPGVRFEFARPILFAREINGLEETVGPATIVDGGITCSFAPYQPRAFAVRLDGPPEKLDPPFTQTIELPFDMEGATAHGAVAATAFDDAGNSLPAELLPATLTFDGIPFRMGAAGGPNVLVCRGQKIALPQGPFDRIVLIGATVGGDRRAAFTVDGKTTELAMQDYAEPIGQWDSRLATGKFREERSQILPAYLKTDPIAWVGTHRHGKDGKTATYAFAQFYAYGLDVAPWSKTLTLPTTSGSGSSRSPSRRTPTRRRIRRRRSTIFPARRGSASCPTRPTSSSRRPYRWNRRMPAPESATRSTAPTRRRSPRSTRSRSGSRRRRPSRRGHISQEWTIRSWRGLS